MWPLRLRWIICQSATDVQLRYCWIKASTIFLKLFSQLQRKAKKIHLMLKSHFKHLFFFKAVKLWAEKISFTNSRMHTFNLEAAQWQISVGGAICIYLPSTCRWGRPHDLFMSVFACRGSTGLHAPTRWCFFGRGFWETQQEKEANVLRRWSYSSVLIRSTCVCQLLSANIMWAKKVGVANYCLKINK